MLAALASYEDQGGFRLRTLRRETHLANGYELDDDPARIDVDAVHRFISEESYWARSHPRDDGRPGRARRAVVGLYHDGRRSASRARSTDGRVLVYLADVYVLDAPRPRPRRRARPFTVDEARSPRAWILHTADAHGLYAKFGFAPAERLLERPAG